MHYLLIMIHESCDAAEHTSQGLPTFTNGAAALVNFALRS